MTSPARTSSAKRKRIAQRFDEALRFQRAGNLEQAERGFVRVLEGDPAHAPALHCLAMLTHRRGDIDAALALMQRAAQGHDVDASVFNNLANMLREAGRASDAIGVYQQAIKHDPSNLNAQFNLAGAMLDSGDGAAAKSGFERVLRESPRDPAAVNGLGHALLMIGEPEAAVQQFQLLAEVAPDEPAARVNLGSALLAADRAPQALANAVSALARFPNTPALLLQQGELQLTLGEYAAATESFRSLKALEPGNFVSYIGLGRSLVAQRCELEAIELAAEVSQRFGERADARMVCGVALKQLGRFDEAAAELERAVALEADFAEAWNNLGMTRMDLGDMPAAQRCFERALELRPDLAQALLNLVRMRRNTDEHRGQLQQLEQMVTQRSRPVDDRVSLHFALGKAFDDLKEADHAFEHYRKGNELKERSAPFDAAAFERWSGALPAVFDAAFFRRCQGFGVASERPVFIVGMPRSGTTLVEQILASHPQVFGAGELTHVMDFAESLHTRVGSALKDLSAVKLLNREVAGELAGEYLEAIAAIDSDADRVTDKMPSNFFHLGLIAALLPMARVIHVVRDPMDSCFSNYIQLFGELHNYSYNLRHIATFYNAYQRIMAHWREVLPLRIHEVSYEALVDDPRTQTSSMLDFLDLPFDEACLQFHRTQRAVGTASHWQVRQPIYRTSKLRWRRYARHLEELAKAIGYDMAAVDTQWPA